MEARKIIGVSGNDFQKVIGGSSHQVALEYIGDPRDRLFKGIQDLVGLPRQRDFDKDRCRSINGSRRQQGHVIADHISFLEPCHSAVTSRRTEMYEF